MNLQPCGGCARHVRSDAPVCPFCGSARAISTPTARNLGRVSRAAVFAGALGACWSSSSPAPNETKREEIPDQASVDPAKEQELAKPPDDAKVANTATTGISIEGAITDSASGGPIVNAVIELRRGG